jgi:hypothetical protein
LTATAFDQKGKSSLAMIQVLVDNRDLAAPSVAVTAPAADAALAGQAALTASAWDPGGPGPSGGVAGVRFRVDGVNIGQEDLTAPYTQAWDTTGVANGTHTVTAVARDAAGNVSVSSGVAVTVLNLSVKVNFQPSGSAVPSGYARDSGSPFGDRGNGFSYGWSSDNNTARDRNAALSPDQRFDTFIQTQQGNTGLSWEIAVPNGFYQVNVVAGDPWAFNSVYRINVEGTLAVDGAPTSGARWVEGTAVVAVTDGRLTLSDATGAGNDKICFIDIARVGSSSPMAAVSTPLSGMPGVDPGDGDPARAKAQETFLSPGFRDGKNDAATFGPEAAEVEVYDLQGRQVFHAVQDEGGGILSWDCRGGSGDTAESGVYIARIRQRGGGTVYQTLTIVK